MKDFGSQIKYVGGNEGDKCNYSARLDTYGCGCQHDCSYCYAKSLLDFRGLWNPKNPSVGDISKISKEIKKIPKGTIVRLGGMTDCFQPLEKLHRVTYKTIRLLNRRKIGYLIVTKSAMVADNEYIKIFDKDLAHIQVTVTTLDDELAKTYEKASPPSERIKAILKLQQEGYDVQLRLSPFIPDFMDLDKLSQLGIDKILVEFLRVNHWIREWLSGKCDLSEYTRTFHGYDHLPFEKKKEYVDRIAGSSIVTVCDFEPEYIDFWKKEYNPNPNDCCNLRRKDGTEN